MRTLPLVSPHQAPSRSPVPDLLFEDEQIRRVAEIYPFLEDPEAVALDTPLHRLTVFLTYHCNLACVYCKTIARSEEELQARPQKRLSYTVEQFQALLASLDAMPIRHLHFTGGEAALVPELSTMVRLARQHGAERLSITSNGTLSAERYLQLIDAGMHEIRISIDAADAQMGRQLTLRDSAWSRTVQTIRRLSEARRRGRPFFLILNAVIGLRNRPQLVDILRFLLTLDPDDIKLITEVDVRDQLASAQEGAGLLAAAKRLLAAYPEERFPLLRRKLRTVFAPDAIGLEMIAPESQPDWRCYIPLTERTVDGEFYYPCSVYLRENGAPMGRLDEPQEMQRARTAAFVRHGDCLRDPICRRYCLHCTRTFNERANQERSPS